MGRPKADLSAYSRWGSYPIPPPTPPNPAWLPVVPTEGVQSWGDLAMAALAIPGVDPMVALFSNFYQPTSATTLSELTSPTAPGLLPQALGTPTRLGTDRCGRSNWTFPAVTFTAAGTGLPVQIWGYYVYCNSPWTFAPMLLWAQRLVSSFGFISAGNALTIPLAVSLGAC
jgi:hypothetical protein